MYCYVFIHIYVAMYVHLHACVYVCTYMIIIHRNSYSTQVCTHVADCVMFTSSHKKLISVASYCLNKQQLLYVYVHACTCYIIVFIYI